MNPETLASVFRAFDVNKSGGIDLDELLSATSVLGLASKLTKARLTKMFQAVDKDNSGEVRLACSCGCDTTAITLALSVH